MTGSQATGLDAAGLTTWLAGARPDLAADPLTATRLEGGRSNLTYRIDGARIPLVLRRPPLGHVLASAHDMRREHRIISALANSPVPVPATIAIVDDTESGRVTGTPFFVMELVEGSVLSTRDQNAAYTAAGLHHLGLELGEILARLHAIEPASVGLADFGHGDGYLVRQLRTWARQLEASRSRAIALLDRLQESLTVRMPQTARTTLVHGDFRLDNALVAGNADAPRVTAVLDWEMSTIGDPLIDLGMFGLYWDIAELPGASGLVPSAVDVSAGYPRFDELADRYAAEASLVLPNLDWYWAFASFKLAVIAEGLHYRWQAGKTVGAGFEHIGDVVEPLAARGLEALALSTGRN